MRDTLWIFTGTGFTFFMTCAGAATVFFFLHTVGDTAQKLFLGFAGGVMLAASVFSLLLPAIEAEEAMGRAGWLPACGGFVIGNLFLFSLDALVRRLQPRDGCAVSPLSRRNILLFSAMTVHNIPEGMSVGLAFGLSAGLDTPGSRAAAVALALGIGVQNFPEGAAISLPFRQNGMGAVKSFLMGCLSGAVEPVFGIATALLAAYLVAVMPWLLAFAAGAMVCVVVKELIPESCSGKGAVAGHLGAMGGFLLMMGLDVAFG